MNIANVQTDLRFQENRIRQGSMAVADGFRRIHSEELWKAHPKEYGSFQAYCEGEWGAVTRENQGQLFAFGYIQNLIRESDRCATINAIVTSPAIAQDVTVVTVETVEQAKALRSAGPSAEEQAEVFLEAVAKAADSPVTGGVIRAVLEERREAIPVGSAIAIKEDSGTIYAGCNGWVTSYDGQIPKVTLRVEGGGTVDNIKVPLSQIEATEGKPMPTPTPAPSPKPAPRTTPKLPPQGERAIALLVKMQHAPDIPQIWLDRIREVLAR